MSPLSRFISTFISFSDPNFDFAAFAIPFSIESIINSLSIDFSKATASAILNNSSLSALLFNIYVFSKKKWAEAHFEISIMYTEYICFF